MFQLRSKITIKVLGYYFLNPSKAHYINELAGILDVDVGNLYRKLSELEREGVLFSEERGSQKYYSLNKRYPLLKEIKRAYNAKHGFVRLLAEKANKIKELKEAYIFGSYAKGSFQNESDIDLLLIGSHSSIEAKRLILPLQKILGRDINILDISQKELASRKKKGDDFIKNIFSHNMIKVYPVSNNTSPLYGVGYRLGQFTRGPKHHAGISNGIY